MNRTCRHVSVSIDRPVPLVYGFAGDPANLPKWAAGLSVLGQVEVKFAEKNDLGVLDHEVTLPTGERFHNPMRVVPNLGGSEVVFTLFRQPGMSDEDFLQDQQAVENDLRKLKSLLESVPEAKGTLGFMARGTGERKVIVLHDWYSDRSEWEPMLPYLSPDRFSYAFADLRGYGSSREMAGEYVLDEAVSDVISLADRLGWARFSLVGHSMSTVVIQRLAQVAPERIERLVAVTPVSPTGLGCDRPTVELFQAIALADDGKRHAMLAPLWGSRLSEEWKELKLRRWRENVEPQAAAKYVELWGCTDVSNGAREVDAPMLIVAAEQDSPPFRPEAIEGSMLPFYKNARLFALAESGHYPMQEQPAMLATVIERFLDGIEIAKNPKTVLRAWIEAFNAADPGRLAELYHVDAINHQVANDPVVGQAAIHEMFRREFALAEMVCVPENIFWDGEWTILEWKDPLGLRGCGFFRITEGKIKFQRGYWDKLSFLRQHGLPIPTA